MLNTNYRPEPWLLTDPSLYCHHRLEAAAVHSCLSPSWECVVGGGVRGDSGDGVRVVRGAGRGGGGESWWGSQVVP